MLFHHHPTLSVDDVDRHGDLGALVAATKRLKAPGMSSPRYHLGSIVIIVIKVMVVGRLV